MKSLVAIIGLTLGCVGCGHAPQVSVPDDFQPYVQSFLAASATVGPQIQIVDLVIQYGTPTSEDIADCEITAGQSPTINVDPNLWPALSSFGQEIIIWHELGHCVLFRQHNPATFTTGECANEKLPFCPESIMNPSADTFETEFETVFNVDRQAYIQELFGQGSGPQ